MADSGFSVLHKQNLTLSLSRFHSFSAPRSFSFDAFYTSLGVDKLSVTCRERPPKPQHRESIFAFPFRLEQRRSKQTGPKQYDIYHISITLNASVSILHCLNHTPVTRHTRCGRTIMGRYCSPPSGALIRLACAQLIIGASGVLNISLAHEKGSIKSTDPN